MLFNFNNEKNCFEKKNRKKERCITAGVMANQHQKERGIKEGPCGKGCVYAEPFGWRVAPLTSPFAFAGKDLQNKKENTPRRTLNGASQQSSHAATTAHLPLHYFHHRELNTTLPEQNRQHIQLHLMELFIQP